MHGAAINGNMAELELVAEWAPDRINNEATEFYGETPLHYAAHCEQEAAVSFLLSAGANVNQTDNNGRTPLYSASNIRASNTRVKQLLIDAGGHW